jgi:cell wall-associated NlpC family hydrolase
MSKLNFYSKMFIAVPTIASMALGNAAMATEINPHSNPAAVEQVSTSPLETQVTTANTLPGTSSNSLINESNTEKIELSASDRARLKNVLPVDLPEEARDMVQLIDAQNQAADKAIARSAALNKMMNSIIETRDELAAKADAEKKAEEEKAAKAKAEEEAAKKKADEEKAKTEAAKKIAETQTSPATVASATNTTAGQGSATVSVQSNTQTAYTPTAIPTTAPVATSSGNVYSSNFDVKLTPAITGTTADVNTGNLDATRAGIVKTAETGLGGAYIWGGKTFRAWDCSGFVSWVFAQHGIKLTAYTYSMVGELKPTSAPKPGDIVFQNGYSHVGIYLGDGKMISALNPSEGTLIHSVSIMHVDGYYTAL